MTSGFCFIRITNPGRSVGWRPSTLALLLFGAVAVACASTKDVDTDKALVDRLSTNQCDRTMRAYDRRVGDMEVLLKSGKPASEVLEEVQRLRHDILGVQAKCSGSDTATKKLTKLDKDLEALEQHLEIESYR